MAENYEIAKVNLLVTVRKRDTTLQNIIAPPTSIDNSANAANQATQTNNLITGINNILNFQDNLLRQWITFQTQRLLLFRDLGLMPYDEWEAFYEFFPTGTSSRNAPRGRKRRSCRLWTAQPGGAGAAVSSP